MHTITFDAGARDFVLDAFGKGIDEEGYIVDKQDGKTRVPSIDDGTPINVNDFAGVAKGSEIYVKSDIVSLIELCDRITARV